jgi:5'-nucleotidase/UDP-sugar diphosphatase
MKFAIPAIAPAALSLLIAAGCQMQSKPATTDSAALNVSPAPEPVAYSAPTPMAAPDPALSTSTPVASSASNNSYTVKKGDTLWQIAASHYGDGKKWREIASANPGLTPSALRVGQTIELP